MSEKKKILLIDTFGLMYRFFYTLPPMTAPGGLSTNAAFGLMRVLLKLIRESGADYIVPALESKTPTFRHEMFPDYKAHREKMPDRLREQLPIIEEIFPALRLTPAQADGFEADDLIGTLSRTAFEAGLDVDIITGDKDLLQLVQPGIRVLMSKKGVTDLEPYDSEKVVETLGVPPDRVIDKKALEGDKSDNIPGVPGIGEKTAKDLINRFGSLENIYVNIDSIDSSKLKDKLANNKPIADLSLKLATINKHVPVNFPLENFSVSEIDIDAAFELVNKYSFKSIARELGLDAVADPSISSSSLEAPSGFKTITEENKSLLSDMISKAYSTGYICVDLETTGLDPFCDSIVGFAIAVEQGDACYIPVAHEAPDQEYIGSAGDLFADAYAPVLLPGQLSADFVVSSLKPLLENPSVGKYGHNLKFDWLMLRAAGIKMQGIAFDSMIASYLLNPDTRGHGLKALAGRMLNTHFKSYKDICGTGKSEISFKMVSLDIATDYAANDVDSVLRIKEELVSGLKERELINIFEIIEIPLVQVLAEMEWNGVFIDGQYLRELSIKMAEQERLIVSRAHELTGIEFNLNSPKQVSELLFERLGLPRIKKDSTDISVLEELKQVHDIVPILMEFRRLSKLRGTYVDALPALIKKRTGRVHTSFNQTVTATGRLSSSDPNLQNIPIRNDDGREIRKAFAAPEKGTVLVSADYSQVEIRLLAHFSADEGLLSAFRNNEDIHTRTAADVFGVQLEDVSPDQRRFAKTINFGIIYGMREFKLSQTLGISRHEAARFIESYFARFPMVKVFVDETVQRLALDGFVTTLFGRRRYFPEISSRNKNERDAAIRAAVNTRIQGTAADIMKLAMIRVHEAIQAGSLPAKMILQVHDELVFEASASDTAAVTEIVRNLMEHAWQPHAELLLPLPVDISTGLNWLDMEKTAG